MRRILLLAACTTITTLAPYMVRAQVPPETKDGIDPLALYLQAGINGEQQEKIRQMGADLEQLNIGRAHELMSLIHTMRQLSLQPNLDEKKILATQEKINQLQDAMATERIKLNIKVRKLLSPAQREKLVTLLQQQRSAPSPPPAPAQ